MISRRSADATMRQTSIQIKSDGRLGWTTRDELGLTGGLLDNSREDVFTAPYISQIGT